MSTLYLCGVYFSNWNWELSVGRVICWKLRDENITCLCNVISLFCECCFGVALQLYIRSDLIVIQYVKSLK